MAMQYDVLAGVAATNDSTTVANGRVRLKGLVITYAASGTITVKDGGSGGDTVYSFTAPAEPGCINVLIPGEGILCETNLYVTCSNGTLATVFYG
jgi:hypothetical protein